jgi:hypothetical protein
MVRAGCANGPPEGPIREGSRGGGASPGRRQGGEGAAPGDTSPTPAAPGAGAKQRAEDDAVLALPDNRALAALAAEIGPAARAQGFDELSMFASVMILAACEQARGALRAALEAAKRVIDAGRRLERAEQAERALRERVAAARTGLAERGELTGFVLVPPALRLLRDHTALYVADAHRRRAAAAAAVAESWAHACRVYLAWEHVVEFWILEVNAQPWAEHMNPKSGLGCTRGRLLDGPHGVELLSVDEKRARLVGAAGLSW